MTQARPLAVRPRQRRSLAAGYLLWALALVGLCGLQRFYARRPVSGTLWLCTLGLCGVGQLLDLFLMPGLIEQANRQGDGLALGEPVDRQLLALARRSGAAGFTLNDALLELKLPADLPRERVREEVERLLFDHLLDVGNDERGRVVYREP
ncbi:NINE protein [Vulcanococcus limneticus]|jgi:TM2 domain-containing membrane protein YozV|uniref:NINE protein n=1 Tax=Vulcanococcus limneticus TaxID=2170428 RepID=UPI00398C17E0